MCGVYAILLLGVVSVELITYGYDLVIDWRQPYYYLRASPSEHLALYC